MKRIRVLVLLLSACASLPILADEGRIPLWVLPKLTTTPAPYILTRDLTISGGVAIDIQVDGVTLDLNGHTITQTGTGDIIQISGTAGLSKGVTIRNGRLSGGSSAIHALAGASRNVSISDLEIGMTTGDAIRVEDALNVRVSGCTIERSGGRGISVSTSSGDAAVAIEDNSVAASADPIWVDDVRNLLVSGNRPRPVDPSDPMPCPIFPIAGINLNNVSGAIIADNVVVGPGSVGRAIDGISLDATSQGNLLRNNAVTRMSRYGINAASQGNDISYNLVNMNASHGIFVSGQGNLIEWNKVGQNSGNGIFWNSAPPSPSEHVFRYNVLRTNSAGSMGGAPTGRIDGGGNIQ